MTAAELASEPRLLKFARVAVSECVEGGCGNDHDSLGLNGRTHIGGDAPPTPTVVLAFEFVFVFTLEPVLAGIGTTGR